VVQLDDTPLIRRAKPSTDAAAAWFGLLNAGSPRGKVAPQPDEVTSLIAVFAIVAVTDGLLASGQSIFRGGPPFASRCSTSTSWCS
jgi:hypothetical protein